METLFGAGGQSVEEYAASVGKSVDEVKRAYNDLITAQEGVMEDAANAYKTAGMSANEYMETVTSFAAALSANLGGDTMAAAEYARVAVTDILATQKKLMKPLTPFFHSTKKGILRRTIQILFRQSTSYKLKWASPARPQKKLRPRFRVRSAW